MTTPNENRKRTHGRTPRIIASCLGLFGLGAAAGAIASVTTSAGAATSSTSSAPPQGSAGTGPAGTAAAGTGSSSTPPPPAGHGLPLTGTVTAVGTADVTIKTATATTTYAVTSTSDIDKNGEATLSDLAVGDTVTFSTVTTNGTTAIDRLHAGNEQLDRPPAGGPGGPGGPLAESGTVTAVGSGDVTIKTSTATTTYAVTSTSDIDKNGEAALSDLVVGDAVRFSTVTSNGTTSIDKLHAGNEQLDMPHGGGPGPDGGAPPSSTQGSNPSA